MLGNIPVKFQYCSPSPCWDTCDTNFNVIFTKNGNNSSVVFKRRFKNLHAQLHMLGKVPVKCQDCSPICFWDTRDANFNVIFTKNGNYSSVVFKRRFKNLHAQLPMLGNIPVKFKDCSPSGVRDTCDTNSWRTDVRTDRQTDGRTDGRTEWFHYTPQNTLV